MICLDTNAVIALMRDKHRPMRFKYRDAVAAGCTIAISTIVLFEFHYGIARSRRRHDNSVQLEHFLSGPVSVLAFEPEDAVLGGEIRAGLMARGEPIGPCDLLIAAQALRHGATLVTANTRELRRVPGLRVEDWAAA